MEKTYKSSIISANMTDIDVLSSPVAVRSPDLDA
jgi:hypothetical protein